VLDKYIGTGWRRDLTQLGGLEPLAHTPALIKALQDAKRANKQRLADWIQANMGLELPVHAMFDVQVKRIHEYKRQLLNVLHVIARYQRILREPQADVVPRVVVFAGKAASAYHMAKLIIQLINDVANTVNNDPRVGDKLKVVSSPTTASVWPSASFRRPTCLSKYPRLGPRRPAPAI